MDEMRLKGVFTEANLEFQGKILERSGLGDETGLSDGIAAMKDGDVSTSLRAALDESEMVLYDVVEQLINKANIDPQEVRCCLFHNVQNASVVCNINVSTHEFWQPPYGWRRHLQATPMPLGKAWFQWRKEERLTRNAAVSDDKSLLCRSTS